MLVNAEHVGVASGMIFVDNRIHYVGSGGVGGCLGKKNYLKAGLT